MTVLTDKTIAVFYSTCIILLKLYVISVFLNIKKIIYMKYLKSTSEAYSFTSPIFL